MGKNKGKVHIAELGKDKNIKINLKEAICEDLDWNDDSEHNPVLSLSMCRHLNPHHPNVM
jgi:hypothetical protein